LVILVCWMDGGGFYKTKNVVAIQVAQNVTSYDSSLIDD